MKYDLELFCFMSNMFFCLQLQLLSLDILLLINFADSFDESHAWLL